MRAARSSTCALRPVSKRSKPRPSPSRTRATMTSSTPRSTARTSTGRTTSTSPDPAGESRPGLGAPRMASHEERDEVADFGVLRLREPVEASVRRPAEPEPPELAGEACPLDPPERLEELDERDPGRVR